MKESVRRQFLGFMMAVILFLSGMCVELPYADTSFLYAKDTCADERAGSVLSDGTKLAKLERVCTIATLQKNTFTFLSSSRSRNLGKRILKNVAIFAAVEILLSGIFLSYGMADTASLILRSSRGTIVRYIQQTDGKK
ncbi:MAG: hypothetical protein IKU69_03675 [Roseburia sp.]|nr:hypothetical protein [Roseburia sp.]